MVFLALSVFTIRRSFHHRALGTAPIANTPLEDVIENT